KVVLREREELVRNATLRDLGDCLRPRERGALSGCEERRLVPNGDGVDALLGLAGVTRLLRMYVHTVGAAIHIGCAQLDEMHQALLEARLPHVHLERTLGADRVWCNACVIQTIG